MTDEATPGVGRIVHVYIGVLSDQGPFAAIVTGDDPVEAGAISVFCFRVGFPQPLPMPKVHHAATGKVPYWKWPTRE